MAGIIEQVEDSNLAEQAAEQLRSDADFRRIVEAYLHVDSPNGRKRIAAVVTALAQPTDKPSPEEI